MGRKGKAVPASSAKALEICGDTSKLGVSPADVFAQFGAPISKAADEAQTAALGDVEVSLALQALQKKDPTTRLRAVAELRELITGRDSGALAEACAPFLHIYRRLWPQDSESRVREGLQRCLQALVETLQRDFAKHLRSAFPTWLCAMFDTHAEVAQAARGAFTAAFPSDEKRRGVFRHCQKDCLQLLTSNLRHSEQSLHDELGLPAGADRDTALQRQDRYARVLAASLSALGELANVCCTSSEPGQSGSLSGEQLKPFFEAGSPCGVWPRVASKQPALIRRAAVQCLMRVFRSLGRDPSSRLQFATASHRAAALNVMADEAIPPSTAAAFVKEFAVAGEGNDCWEGLVASKSLWPICGALLKRGAGGAARRDVVADFLSRFQELLQVFPTSAWVPGKAEMLLTEILQSLVQARGAFAAAAEDAWKAYFAVCAAAAANAPVSQDWKWHPLALYLGSRAPAQASDPQLPEVVLAPAALSALPAAVATGLSSEDGGELLHRLEEGAAEVEVGSDAGHASLRAWTNLVQALQSSKGAAGSLREELHGAVGRQLRRVLGTALRSTPSVEMLESLRKLLACDFGDGLDCQDPELRDALGTSASEGPQDVPECWPKEAKVLLWPILPWVMVLQEARSPAAAEVAQHLARPQLAALARRPEPLGSAFTERLEQVLLPQHPGSVEAGPLSLSLSLRLALECVPPEFRLGTSPRLCEAVHELVALLASTSGSPPFLDEALAALALAFRPLIQGGMESQQTTSCLRSLASKTSSSAPDGRLLLLLGKAMAEQEEDLEELVPVTEVLLRQLLAGPGPGGGDEGDGGDGSGGGDAWGVVAKLLAKAGVAQAAAIFAKTWPSPVSAPLWVRGLREAAQAMPCSAVALLCRTRARRGGGCDSGDARLLPEGSITREALRENAVVTSLVLEGHQEGTLDTLDTDSALDVVWELLLAASCLGEDNVVIAGAAETWAILLRSSSAMKLSFLRLAVREAASEGGSWRVCESQGAQALPASARLAGLSPLRHLLAAMWTDASTADALGAEGFLAWSLSEEPSREGAMGWGHAAAAVLRQSAHAGVLEGDRLLMARDACRARIRTSSLTGPGAITEQLLVYATAVEEAAQLAQLAQAGKVPPQHAAGGPAGAPVSDGPVIAEVPAAQVSQAASTVPEQEGEDIDTGLMESIEKLLRWSQASSSRADTFAGFAAASWPALAANSTTDSIGRLSSRMVRVALEGTGAGAVGLARGAAESPAPAAPGTWQLIAALCKAGQWPEANWPSVLQALSKANAWLLHDGDPVVCEAFVDDACAAAASLLPHTPSACVDRLAGLLSAPEARLRAAAALRLQQHCWVPGCREALSRSAHGLSGPEALDSLEALLEADSQPADSATIPPSSADVAYTVLGAVLGSELTEVVWSVEDALSAVAAWETGDSEEESEADEPGEAGQAASTSSRGYGRRFRAARSERGASEEREADPATPASSSRCRRKDWMAARPQLPLPPDVERQSASTLAAWETLLRGIDRGLLEKGFSGSVGATSSSEKATSTPAELLASVLQLTSDQLSRSGALATFPTKVAPASHWDTPLQPLLRLLCHLLTSGKLAKPHHPAAEANGEPFELLALAERTLLLALRVAPAGSRRFWEELPRKRDQMLVEQLISRNFSHQLIQAEAAAASAQLEAERDRLEDIDASVIRRQRQLLLLLQREELRTELSVSLPPSFPLRPAQAEFPEKMPGIPKPRVRNWMLQARQLLSGPRPMAVGKAVLMWAKSFALFFKGVEDCPICYNVIQLTTQTIPRKACPTCKHKFHNECLYQWFRSSSKTTCPLCNQPF